MFGAIVRRAVPQRFRVQARNLFLMPGARQEYLRSRSPSELSDYNRRIHQYWSQHYGRSIDTGAHLRFTAITGVEDPRFIPQDIWWGAVIPHFNARHLRPAFLDKNAADILLQCDSTPTTYIRRVRGHYFDGSNRSLRRADVWSALLDAFTASPRLIAKPSTTDNGLNITELAQTPDGVQVGVELQSLDSIEKRLGLDFLVQEKIAQHDALALPHPTSVNTMRVVTLRLDDNLHHLGTFARFGNHGSANDNASTGGFIVGVGDTGCLNEVGANMKGEQFTHHTMTHVAFGDVQIPNWSAVPEFALSLHEQVLHHDIISWDIALSPTGKPVFIEMNFEGGVYLYQWALQRPIFGELTEEILHRIGTPQDV